MRTRREALEQARKALDEATAQAGKAFDEAKTRAKKVKKAAPPAEETFSKSTALAWNAYEGFMAWKAYGEIMNEAINTLEEAVAQAEKLPE